MILKDIKSKSKRNVSNPRGLHAKSHKKLYFDLIGFYGSTVYMPTGF